MYKFCYHPPYKSHWLFETLNQKRPDLTLYCIDAHRESLISNSNPVYYPCYTFSSRFSSSGLKKSLIQGWLWLQINGKINLHIKHNWKDVCVYQLTFGRFVLNLHVTHSYITSVYELPMCLPVVLPDWEFSNWLKPPFESENRPFCGSFYAYL